MSPTKTGHRDNWSTLKSAGAARKGNPSTFEDVVRAAYSARTPSSSPAGPARTRSSVGPSPSGRVTPNFQNTTSRAYVLRAAAERAEQEETAAAQDRGADTDLVAHLEAAHRAAVDKLAADHKDELDQQAMLLLHAKKSSSIQHEKHLLLAEHAKQVSLEQLSQLRESLLKESAAKEATLKAALATQLEQVHEAANQSQRELTALRRAAALRETEVEEQVSSRRIGAQLLLICHS